jgi:two-component system, OmpR family, sensor histidine kinase KdpD
MTIASLRFGASEPVQWLLGTFAAVLATVILVIPGANATTAGMVFLLLVVCAATVAGRWVSLYIAALCAISFDYFFLPPVHTLAIVGAQQWLALLTFAASCVVVSRLAERARGQARQAEQRREDVERLYALSQEMMLHDDAAGLMRDLPHLVERIFALDGVMLYVSDHDEFYSSGAEMPASAKASLRAASIIPSATLSAAGDLAVIELTLGLRSVGALGWRPSSRLSREVATAVGAQVAIALTRSIAIEASARLEASREGERLRTALIDSLTHELRTPLTSIRAAATTLMQGEGLDDSGKRDLAALVDEEASRLDMLIGEAVEMAEIDAKVLRVHPVRQLPRALLEQAVEELQEILAGHRVEVSVEGEDKPVWFDPHLLGRVLRHLIENAARYTPAGSHITLRSRREGDRLEFRVEDDGPGIDSLDMPLIFEKFYRGKKGAALGKGTGMGLAIVRAILAAHGGSIEAVSTPGKGTSFRFWVPLVEKEPTSDFERMQERAALGSLEKVHQPLSKVSDVPPDPTDSV